jgi:hypothetical protein
MTPHLVMPTEILLYANGRPPDDDNDNANDHNKSTSYNIETKKDILLLLILQDAPIHS